MWWITINTPTFVYWLTFLIVMVLFVGAIFGVGYLFGILSGGTA